MCQIKTCKQCGCHTQSESRLRIGINLKSCLNFSILWLVLIKIGLILGLGVMEVLALAFLQALPGLFYAQHRTICLICESDVNNAVGR